MNLQLRETDRTRVMTIFKDSIAQTLDEAIKSCLYQDAIDLLASLRLYNAPDIDRCFLVDDIATVMKALAAQDGIS